MLGLHLSVAVITIIVRYCWLCCHYFPELLQLFLVIYIHFMLYTVMYRTSHWNVH